jgi:ABC-type uncharacterized transport system ATPase subunit
MTSSSVLAMQGISTVLGGYLALDRVDFTVDRGEVRGLIGSNGAGKSTLLNVVVGRVEPDAGSVEFLGAEMRAVPAWRRARLGIALKFQVSTVFERLSIEENMRLGAQPKERGGSGNLDLVGDVLDLVGLGPKRDRVAAELGHGERQWLEIGMVLLTGPKLLLLDEPTSGMTLGESHRTAELIDRLRRSGRVEAMVVVEHDIDFIRLVSDRVTVLHRGRVLASGQVDEVQADPAVRDAYLGRLQ